MNEPEVKFCSNCKHEVPSGNFMMHHIHCQRKLAFCQKCDEPIPHSEFAAHNSNFHVIVSCPDCGQQMEKINVAEHQISDCSHRSICCAFCHIEVEAFELLEHENYCGSRTERCEECGEFVMLKYQQLHQDSNHGFLKLEDEPGPTPLWSASRTTPSVLNDLSRQRKISNASQDTTRPTSALNRLSPSKRTNDMPQVNSATTVSKPKALHKTTLPQRNKHDDDTVDLDLLLALRLQDQENSHLTTISAPSAPPEREYHDTGVGGELVALPCEFCEAMIPANQLVLHETGCRPHLTQLVVPPANKVRNEPEISEEEGLPCEFCGDLFPPHLLLSHEDSCEVTAALQESMHVNKLGISPSAAHGIKKRVNKDPPSGPLFPTRSKLSASSYESEDRNPYLMEVRAALKKPTANVLPLGSRQNSSSEYTSPGSGLSRADLPSSPCVNGYARHSVSTGAVPKQKVKSHKKYRAPLPPH
ncbi:hypothetical protein R5R35_012833 [Gryllus longicercus]|uniref:TRAFD1/XAF1 zinc finger domain-containing protein n=1 Tax=Gryllus longicercus TaxID=2509291 RepID=A0AAN9V7V1_9ORTH